MSLFKRLSATMTSHLDQVVGEIENHSAIAKASIQDMRKKTAAAKVRLGHVQRESEKLKKQISEQEENSVRWQLRAIDTAATDEAKALECVRRSQLCKQNSERLTLSQQQYQQTAQTLSKNIQACEVRINEAQQRLTLMQARESTNAANNAMNNHFSDNESLIDNTFERWEINLSADEITGDQCLPVDLVEHEFISQEQEDELRNELAKLIKEQN